MRDSTTASPGRPVVVYDGDCGFCRKWVGRARGWTGEKVEYLAQQEPQCLQRFPQLVPEALQASVHRVEPDGRVSCGAEAVFRTLAETDRWRGWSQFCLRSPVAMAAAEILYRWVARNRAWVSRWTRWW